MDRAAASITAPCSRCGDNTTPSTAPRCHIDNVFAGTPRNCVGCHLDEYEQTSAPNHASAGFPTTCVDCHRNSDPSWGNGQGGGFNHNAVFPLQGQHNTLDCASCHINEVYQGTPTDCVGCHLDDYDQTQAPNHANAGFPTTCDSCHQASDPNWLQGGGFNHNAVFPLQGQHNTLDCASCHINEVYQGTPTDCVGCHLDDYDQTQDPNHANAGFPTTCDSCHQASDPNWLQGNVQPQRSVPAPGPAQHLGLRQLPHQRGVSGHSD